jgi:hypothetical protein
MSPLTVVQGALLYPARWMITGPSETIASRVDTVKLTVNNS